MMEFQKLIEVRRSIRKYATDKKVTKEELMEMIGAVSGSMMRLLPGRILRQGDIIVYCLRR